MQVVAIINRKGGVGKTTSAITIAHGLAQRQCRVLLVDLDGQGNVADSLGLPEQAGLYQFLIDDAGLRAISRSGRKNLDVILGNDRTKDARQTMAGMAFKEGILHRALQRIGEYYDVCVLDAAPGIDILHTSALVAADAFLIPVQLDHLAVVGASKELKHATSLREVGADPGRFLGFLPTFFERTTKESHTQLKYLYDQFGSQNLVWPPIPKDTRVREGPAYGESLWEYAPDCRAVLGVQLNASSLVGGYARVLERLAMELGL